MKRLAISPLMFLVGLALNPLSSHAQSPPGNNYPPPAVSTFVNSCVQGAAEGGVEINLARNICTCSIEGIQQQYTFDQYLAIDQQVADGQPPPENFNRIVTDCVNQYVQ